MKPAAPAAGSGTRGLLRDWAPALLWAGTIFWLSSRPALPLPDRAHADKAAHFGAYLLLGLLLAFALRRRGARGALLALLLGALYGASDEVHQSFVPGRSVELADWLADTLGAIAGAGGFHLLLRRRLPGWRRSAPSSPLPHE